MPVLNIGELLSSLFTWLKLSVSLALLIVLTTKLIDVWQENPKTLGEESQMSEEFLDLVREWKQ